MNDDGDIETFSCTDIIQILLDFYISFQHFRAGIATSERPQLQEFPELRACYWMKAGKEAVIVVFGNSIGSRRPSYSKKTKRVSKVLLELPQGICKNTSLLANHLFFHCLFPAS